MLWGRRGSSSCFWCLGWGLYRVQEKHGPPGRFPGTYHGGGHVAGCRAAPSDHGTSSALPYCEGGSFQHVHPDCAIYAGQRVGISNHWRKSDRDGCSSSSIRIRSRNCSCGRLRCGCLQLRPWDRHIWDLRTVCCVSDVLRSPLHEPHRQEHGFCRCWGWG